MACQRGPITDAPVRASSEEVRQCGPSLRGKDAMTGVPVRTPGASLPTVDGVRQRGPPIFPLQIAPVRALQEGQVCASEGGLSSGSASAGIRGHASADVRQKLLSVRVSESASADSPVAPVRATFGKVKSDRLARGNAVHFPKRWCEMVHSTDRDDEEEGKEMCEMSCQAAQDSGQFFPALFSQSNSDLAHCVEGVGAGGCSADVFGIEGLKGGNAGIFLSAAPSQVESGTRSRILCLK